MPSWVSWACLAAALLAASVWDLRTRRVPAWLTLGLIGGGLIAGALHGVTGLVGSAVGLLVGLLLPIPLVWFGGLGLADALILAGIGSWEGWQLALRTAWWAAIAGGLAALLFRWRGRRSFAYIPALAVGFGLAALV